MLAMSEHDIYVEFKTAKDPVKQISILADLNATTPERIAEIINKKVKEEPEMTVDAKKAEQKAKKAAYMKKYWERKKAEKAAKESETPVTTETEIEKPNVDDAPLIRKAILYYSADLAEAVKEQRQRVEVEQEKLAAMEKDLRRCQEMLGKEEARNG